MVIVLVLLAAAVASGALAGDSEQALRAQVDGEIQAGQTDAAMDLARRALQQYPTSSLLNQLLGVALFKKGLKDEAAKAFNKAIELDPSVSGNYFDLALIELSNRDAHAIEHLETFVRLEPSNAQGHLVLGHAYQYANMTLPAIAQYQKALQLQPALPLGYYHLGLAYRSQGNSDAALEDFENEIRINPSYCEPYVLAGSINRERGNLDAAEGLYRKGIACKLENFEAHYGLARVLLAKNDLQAARVELESCVRLNDTSIEAHYTLANTYQRLGRKDGAANEYKIVSALHARRHMHVSSGIASTQK